MADGNSPADRLNSKTRQSQSGSPSQVSFSRQIVPVLAGQCLSCHSQDERSGGLSLHSLAAMRRGGNRGALLGDGSGAESLLVRKLRGTADGARMPRDADPLESETIALLEKWIDQGALPGTAGADQPISEIARQVQLASASEEELNAERLRRAKQNWQLAFPGKPFISFESDRFLVVANVGPEQGKLLTTSIQEAWRKARKTLQLNSDQLVPRGRTTIYVLERPYDLSEFALMVEGRSLSRPPEDLIWKGSATDAYLAIVVPNYAIDHETALAAGITAVCAQTSLALSMPVWFVQGLADAVGIRHSPDNPTIQRLISEARWSVRQLDQPEDFIRNRTTTAVRRRAAASYVSFLIRSENRFKRLIDHLQTGATLDDALKLAYGKSNNELLLNWFSAAGGHRNRGND